MLERNHTLIKGDARHMLELPDASVQLVVTSPPYWQLKDYGGDEQIGFHDSYETYINNLNLVWQECARVLHPGCRMAINIGDQFARSTYYGRYKVIPIRTEIIRFCETIGLDYMGAIIWQKVTTCNSSGGGAVMGSFPYPRNGVLKLDYEFILIFKKPGKAPSPSDEARAATKMTTEEWNTLFAGHWQFPGARQTEHIAVFPQELPDRLIRMFTFPGEVVLDPFLGSGTTTVAAKDLDRRSVGYEISDDCWSYLTRRFGLDGQSLFDVNDVSAMVQASDPERLQQIRAGLPYSFCDPLPVKRKVDPRKKSYNSVLTRNQKKAPSIRVEVILAPDRIKLSDGRTVRLIGIIPVPGTEKVAMDWLREQTGRRQVIIKTDKQCPGIAGEDAIYLRLKNQTNLNAHLIRQGYATPATDYPYSLQSRFQRYQEDTMDN